MTAIHGLLAIAFFIAVVWLVEAYRLGHRADDFELHAEQACELTDPDPDLDDEYRTLCDRFGAA